MSFIFYFQYGFSSSGSLADILTIATDRTAEAFSMSGATWTVEIDIVKVFDRIWDVGLLHKT